MDGLGSDLDIRQIAELPELFGGTGVLVEDSVGSEDVQLAGTEAVDGATNVFDEFTKRAS